MTVPKAPLYTLLLIGLVVPWPSFAGVLPDDRADALYHRYQGGGVTIQGPSVLVRKKIGEKLAVTGNYYMDFVSSASIDVQLSASPYKEKRTQKSLAVDYLRGKSTYSVGFINSEETDYKADTSYFSISQDMFGDLTTVTLSFKRGWDDVFSNQKLPDGTKVHSAAFGRKQQDHRGYALGLTQILTRNMILGLNYEVLEDEGFLNSPYRSVRYLDPTDPRGWNSQSEIYPGTHTSNAVSARLKYYLPYRAALDGQYRFYTDTWGVVAHTVEVDYTHPARKRWVFDGSLRYYRQTAADFYSDLFPRRDFANFLARDKELSQFSGLTAGVGASYEFSMPRFHWVQKSTANLRLDRLMIRYDNFRDARVTKNAPGSVAAGAEPLYELDANVIQAFVSIWF